MEKREEEQERGLHFAGKAVSRSVLAPLDNRTKQSILRRLWITCGRARLDYQVTLR